MNLADKTEREIIRDARERELNAKSKDFERAIRSYHHVFNTGRRSLTGRLGTC